MFENTGWNRIWVISLICFVPQILIYLLIANPLPWTIGYGIFILFFGSIVLDPILFRSDSE